MSAMPYYYVNESAQPNGDHEVHRLGCAWLALAHNTMELGQHENCAQAVAAARLLYATANGCSNCSPECNGRLFAS
jgi:hypothetical protein